MAQMPLKIRREVEDYAEENNLSKKQKEELMDRVREFYEKTVYDPEEAMGVVTAQSLSEPATQMSLDWKEKVILKKDGKIRTVPIGEFTDRMVEEFGRKRGEWEVADLSSWNVQVPSLTEEEKIRWKRLEECSRHPSPEELLQIKTASGRSIVATDSHSFVVRRDNKIKAVSGKELSPGERIPVLKNLKQNCVQHLKVNTIIKTKWAKKRLPEKLELDQELGWFIGAYLAEGNCTRNYVSLSTTNPEFLEKVRNFADKYDFSYNEYHNERGFSTSHDIRVNSILLSRLLEKTCRTGSDRKRVPQFAYSAEEDFVSGLLQGYFDGDGNVSAEKRLLRASSNSEELLNGILLLLSRFGIFATKQKGKQFSLLIPYKYAERFEEKIGFSNKEKLKRLEKVVKAGRPEQEFTDMIPGFGNLLQDLARKLGYPTRRMNSFTKRGRIGRETLRRYIHLFRKQAEKTGTDIEEELEKLKKMAYSDVVWDRIEEVNRTKPSSEYVYDFSVEGTETFTTFEGVVTHNTMRTYHFAGTAGIQVTLGLPRLIEIFDARKKPKTPAMTVYLEKGYQTKEKVKKVAERIKEETVKNIITSFSMDLTDSIIRCKLDKKKMKELDIGKKQLKKRLKIRGVKPEVTDDEIIIKSKKETIEHLHKLRHKVLSRRVKGIRKVSQAVITKENGEWIINTLGSNLKKVLKIEGVDPTRTKSNNLWETEKVLGIEATRREIINQTKYTMEEQGLNVDIRYIALLADLMTATGELRAISRYGISGEKASVLVRAGFEETKKHLVNATVKGEKDPLQGTVENVMMNQLAPIGTGRFDLVGHIPKEGRPAKARKPKKKKEKARKLSEKPEKKPKEKEKPSLEWTKKELRKYAQKKEIKIKSSDTKEQILKKVERGKPSMDWSKKELKKRARKLDADVKSSDTKKDILKKIEWREKVEKGPSEDWTKKELKRYAQDKGIRIKSSDTKKQVLKKIKRGRPSMDWTKKELEKRAEKKGADIKSSDTKKDILKKIKKAEK